MLASNGAIVCPGLGLCIVKTWLLRFIPNLNSRPPSTMFVCTTSSAIRLLISSEYLLGIDLHSWLEHQVCQSLTVLTTTSDSLSPDKGSSKEHTDNNQNFVLLFQFCNVLVCIKVPHSSLSSSIGVYSRFLLVSSTNKWTNLPYKPHKRTQNYFIL